MSISIFYTKNIIIPKRLYIIILLYYKLSKKKLNKFEKKYYLTKIVKESFFYSEAILIFLQLRNSQILKVVYMYQVQVLYLNNDM